MTLIRRFITSSAAVALSTATIASCSNGVGSPNDTDRVFVGAMVPHHKLGIELITDAVSRVDDVRLRRLVFKMSAYHDSELHDLEARVAAWDVTVPQQFPGWIDPHEVIAMSTLSGPDYDLRWLDLMIEHHEGALTLADVEASEGADDELRALAHRIADTQRSEIAKMKDILDSLTEG